MGTPWQALCDKHEHRLMVVDVDMSIFLLLILTHLLSVHFFGMNHLDQDQWSEITWIMVHQNELINPFPQ